MLQYNLFSGRRAYVAGLFIPLPDVPEEMKHSAYATKKLSTENLEDSWLIEPMVTLFAEMHATSPATWRHLGRVGSYSMLLGRELGLSNSALMSLHFTRPST